MIGGRWWVRTTDPCRVEPIGSYRAFFESTRYALRPRVNVTKNDSNDRLVTGASHDLVTLVQRYLIVTAAFAGLKDSWDAQTADVFVLGCPDRGGQGCGRPTPAFTVDQRRSEIASEC